MWFNFFDIIIKSHIHLLETINPLMKMMSDLLTGTYCNQQRRYDQTLKHRQSTTKARSVASSNAKMERTMGEENHSYDHAQDSYWDATKSVNLFHRIAQGVILNLFYHKFVSHFHKHIILKCPQCNLYLKKQAFSHQF
jgi:hypothetical protein